MSELTDALFFQQLAEQSDREFNGEESSTSAINTAESSLEVRKRDAISERDELEMSKGFGEFDAEGNKIKVEPFTVPDLFSSSPQTNTGNNRRVVLEGHEELLKKDPQLKINITKSLTALNALKQRYFEDTGEEMLLRRGKQGRVKGKSRHTLGLGADIADPKGRVARWAFKKELDEDGNVTYPNLLFLTNQGFFGMERPDQTENRELGKSRHFHLDLVGAGGFSDLVKQKDDRFNIIFSAEGKERKPVQILNDNNKVIQTITSKEITEANNWIADRLGLRQARKKVSQGKSPRRVAGPKSLINQIKLEQR
jgi:hypothetical protein